MKKKMVWAVVASNGAGFGLPIRVFKSQKKAMKYAASLNDSIESAHIGYGAYPIIWDGDKK